LDQSRDTIDGGWFMTRSSLLIASLCPGPPSSPTRAKVKLGRDRRLAGTSAMGLSVLRAFCAFDDGLGNAGSAGLKRKTAAGDHAGIAARNSGRLFNTSAH
jgi:hypothetical protein